MNSVDLLHLELLNTRGDTVHKYAQFTLDMITYHRYRTIEEEIFRMQTMSHISHYWILRGAKHIGVVKISLFHFYDFGILNEYNDIIPIALETIERKMRGSFTGRLHGNLQSKYMDHALKLGWELEYSRYNMKLNFGKETNLKPYTHLRYKNFNDEYISKVTDLFKNAYKGGVDENIGMISQNTMIDSVQDVIYGKYGKVLYDQSIVVFNKWGRAIGASIITESEGCAFLVIVGVRKKDQHKGLGRAMLSYNIEKCKEVGYHCMKLWVTDGNPSIQLYRSIGFEDIDKISAIYKKRTNAF